ncbi:MAG: cytochrome c [Acidobacteria bacterium]|nr:cytochrome c [Acidobacteriota bacterium]
MVVTGFGVAALAGAITVRAAMPSPIPHPPASSLHSQATKIDAAALYKLHCQVCHGANGKAPLPEMAFVGRDWKHGTASVQMAKVIAEGVKGTPMMPFKGKLKPEQITALAKHVRAFDTRLKPEKQ